MEARPAGPHTCQLMAAIRLTRSQVGRGMRHVRDVVAENLTPIMRTLRARQRTYSRLKRLRCAALDF